MNKLLNNFLAHGENEYTHKKLGLERIRRVLAHLDHPERSFPSVLIAGTNGKGSVARMLEAVLLEAGYPVGLYTSPHLVSFTERIRVGGMEVPEEELGAVLEFFEEKGLLHSDGSFGMPKADALTWFEKTTVLAFEVFRRRRVPLALLEVGLGARLDATNVADPIVSVITSIGRDHTEVLGDSLFEIAREKLAVMRPGRPLILGFMNENVRTFLSKAARMGEAKPVLPQMPSGSWESFSYGPFENMRLGLRGQHQVKNAAAAIETLSALRESGFAVDNRHVRRGLQMVEFPGRMELIQGTPDLLLDGAHNEDAIKALVECVQHEWQRRKIAVVLGMMKEKDMVTALNILSRLEPFFYITEIPSPRSVSLEQWRALCSRLGVNGKFIKDLNQALVEARRYADSNGLVVVTGSLYLAGATRSLC